MEKQKRNIKEEGKLANLLSFVENNVSKEDFIAWLNTQHAKTFSEENSWEYIKTELMGGNGVPFAGLQTYAKSLGNEQDVEKLLTDVKESTQQAEKTAERLSYLSTYKKFAVAIGGATVLVGILLALLSVAIFFQFIGESVNPDLAITTASIAMLIGLLNILSGLLLATR